MNGKKIYDMKFDVLIEFVDNDEKMLLDNVGHINHDNGMVFFLSEKMFDYPFYMKSISFPVRRIKKISTVIKSIRETPNIEIE